MLQTNNAHIHLARFLYNELSKLNRDDASELTTYGKVLDALVFYKGANNNSININDELDGLILDLKHWVSLKRDAPEQARDFGAGIKDLYKELLEK